MLNAMSIGALAHQSGVKVPTIRYYESVGLLPEPDRAGSNRRIYGVEAVRRLRFIRHARELGFATAAIRQLLSLADDPDRPCHEADGIARARLNDIDQKIARLLALRTEVQNMVDQCAQQQIKQCHVIEILAGVG